MHLESNIIIIRKFCLNDGAELRELLSGEYIAKWMPGWFKFDEQEIVEWLHEVINDYADCLTKNDCSYAVIDKLSGALIGRADCTIKDDNEIGATIIINPNYIEQGCLTEAYRLFTKCLISMHSDKSIEIISQAENAVESKAIEELGLPRVEISRIKEVKTFNHYRMA